MTTQDLQFDAAVGFCIVQFDLGRTFYSSELEQRYGLSAADASAAMTKAAEVFNAQKGR